MYDKENKAKYDIEYAKKNLKRIPLDVSKDFYSTIQNQASINNESVNGYIKKAIRNRIESEQNAPK